MSTLGFWQSNGKSGHKNVYNFLETIENVISISRQKHVKTCSFVYLNTYNPMQFGNKMCQEKHGFFYQKFQKLRDIKNFDKNCLNMFH